MISRMVHAAPRRVEQRTEKDCLLCCLATHCDVSYDEIRGRLGVLGASIASRGANDRDLEAALAALGFTSGRDYLRLTIAPQWASTAFVRHILWGRAALVTVRSKNARDALHVVYWTGRELIDSSPYAAYAWPEAEPLDIVIFDQS